MKQTSAPLTAQASATGIRSSRSSWHNCWSVTATAASTSSPTKTDHRYHRSARQSAALKAINTSLKSGVLSDKAKRKDLTGVRADNGPDGNGLSTPEASDEQEEQVVAEGEGGTDGDKAEEAKSK